MGKNTAKTKNPASVGLIILFSVIVIGMIFSGLCIGHLIISKIISGSIFLALSTNVVVLLLLLAYGAFGYKVKRGYFLKGIILFYALLNVAFGITLLVTSLEYKYTTLMLCLSSLFIFFIAGRLYRYKPTIACSCVIGAIFLALAIYGITTTYLVGGNPSSSMSIISYMITLSPLFIWGGIFTCYLVTCSFNKDTFTNFNFVGFFYDKYDIEQMTAQDEEALREIEEKENAAVGKAISRISKIYQPLKDKILAKIRERENMRIDSVRGLNNYEANLAKLKEAELASINAAKKEASKKEVSKKVVTKKVVSKKTATNKKPVKKVSKKVVKKTKRK